jgi:protein-L-isoaspartate(D-aspartate) O-methyltransferase
MDYATARQNMVKSQIKPNRVTDPLIMDALAQLPRELFVPKAMRGIAYIDEAIDIGDGRHLMETWVLSRLLQAAEVQPDDVALVIGCGSGYEAAILSTMASTVVALESDEGLVKQANDIFAELFVNTVAVVDGGLALGYSGQAPYDVIFINGAVSVIPERLGDQLAEGGRLVSIVGLGALGKGTLITRYNDVITSRIFFDASTPMLPGFETDLVFSF